VRIRIVVNTRATGVNQRVLRGVSDELAAVGEVEVAALVWARSILVTESSLATVQRRAS
jgi:hypothetical protein